jgi:hypothetical protein
MNRSDAGKLGWAKTKGTMLAHTAKKKNEARDRYAKAPQKCRRCEVMIPYEQRDNSFCSSSCSATWINAKRIRVRSCEGCGQDLKRGGKQFCSVTCQHKVQWKARAAEITAAGKMISTDPRSARRYLAETHGWKCATCEITKWQGQATPLVLNHIDGNSDNWSLMNLQLICPNCDAQTPTYKARNRGNGRFSRRQRYQNGKSF